MKKSLFLTMVMVCAIALTGQAFAETTFDFSGQLRFRPEMRDNSDFNSGSDDKQGFIGSRARFTVKATVAEDVFAKITLQDVRQWGQEGNVNTSMEGTDVQAVDIFEGYFQVNKIGGSPIGIKAGRQTLVYGDQRLLGHLGWKDQARTHDALKVIVDLGKTRIDLIASKEDESGKPSDEKNDADLMGVYAMTKLAEKVQLDIYLLNWKTASTDADGNAAKGHNIMTYGARFKAVMGGFDGTAEAVFQSGDWAEGVTQSANAFAVRVGYKLNVLGGTRIGVEYDHGSGDDDPSDNEHKTFVFPYHTNHGKYGYMDYFSWGNMNDIQINLKTKPMEKVVVKLDYHIFTLDNGNDDWLNVVGTKAFKSAVAGKDSTDAGTEIDLTVVYKALKNLKLVFGYSIFQPGEAAKERSSDNSDTSNWSYLMTIFNF